MRVSPNLLRRIDDARNMRRDYRLDMQPDLFGGVSAVQMKGWAFPREEAGSGSSREERPKPQEPSSPIRVTILNAHPRLAKSIA